MATSFPASLSTGRQSSSLYVPHAGIYITISSPPDRTLTASACHILMRCLASLPGAAGRRLAVVRLAVSGHVSIVLVVLAVVDVSGDGLRC